MKRPQRCFSARKYEFLKQSNSLNLCECCKWKVVQIRHNCVVTMRRYHLQHYDNIKLIFLRSSVHGHNVVVFTSRSRQNARLHCLLPEFSHYVHIPYPISSSEQSFILRKKYATYYPYHDNARNLYHIRESKSNFTQAQACCRLSWTHGILISNSSATAMHYLCEIYIGRSVCWIPVVSPWFA